MAMDEQKAAIGGVGDRDTNEKRGLFSESEVQVAASLQGGFGLYVTDGDSQRLGGWSKHFIGRL